MPNNEIVVGLPGTWYRIKCDVCGAIFSYRTYPISVMVSDELICPVCGYNFGVIKGYVGEIGDVTPAGTPAESPKTILEKFGIPIGLGVGGFLTYMIMKRR